MSSRRVFEDFLQHRIPDIVAQYYGRIYEDFLTRKEARARLQTTQSEMDEWVKGEVDKLKGTLEEMQGHIVEKLLRELRDNGYDLGKSSSLPKAEEQASISTKASLRGSYSISRRDENGLLVSGTQAGLTAREAAKEASEWENTNSTEKRGVEDNSKTVKVMKPINRKRGQAQTKAQLEREAKAQAKLNERNAERKRPKELVAKASVFADGWDGNGRQRDEMGGLMERKNVRGAASTACEASKTVNPSATTKRKQTQIQNLPPARSTQRKRSPSLDDTTKETSNKRVKGAPHLSKGACMARPKESADGKVRRTAGLLKELLGDDDGD